MPILEVSVLVLSVPSVPVPVPTDLMPVLSVPVQVPSVPVPVLSNSVNEYDHRTPPYLHFKIKAVSFMSLLTLR